MNKRETFSVEWSNDDQCYVCRMHNLEHVATHGKTVSEAKDQMMELLAMVIEELILENLQLRPREDDLSLSKLTSADTQKA